MASRMDFDEEKRVSFDLEHKPNLHHEVDDDDKKEELVKKKNKMRMISKNKCPLSSSSSSIKLKSNNYKASPLASVVSASSSSTIRVCDFCGKTFNSGKALGGHRRFHIQNLKKIAQAEADLRNSHSDNKKAKNDEDDDDDNDMKLNKKKKNVKKLGSYSSSCCICKKEFPSEKSLFGHMRSHPEREWRGVHPPFYQHHHHHHISVNIISEIQDMHNTDDGGEGSPSPKSSSAPTELVVNVDLSLSCSPSWRKKDRRGRRSIAVAEAANNLVFLSGSSHGTDFSDLTPPPFKKRKNIVIDDDHGSSEEDEEDEDDEEMIWKLREEIKANKKEYKKMKKKMKMKNVVEAEKIQALEKKIASSSVYECNICHRSFPSFQGLGGHMSKHNKDKNNNINLNMTSTNNFVCEEEPEADAAAANKVCNNNNNNIDQTMYAVHGGDDNNNGMIKCDISTGTLRGQGEVELGEASHQSASKMLDFDLNEPCVMDQDM